SWETFKVSITNSTPNGVVSLQMVKGSVLNEEMRRKTQGSSSQSKVFVTENRGRSQKNERENNRSKSKSRYKNVECHYYHKTGHIQKHCFLWKKENKGKKGKSKGKDDDCVTTATCDCLVILRDFELVNFVSDESMWIIDSGATLHVTPKKEFFTSYTAGDFGVLKMGNDGVTKVIGVGDVCLQTNTRMQLWLRRPVKVMRTWNRDSCKLGEYLSAALCHHIGGALLVVPYYLPIIKRGIGSTKCQRRVDSRSRTECADSQSIREDPDIKANFCPMIFQGDLPPLMQWLPATPYKCRGVLHGLLLINVTEEKIPFLPKKELKSKPRTNTRLNAIEKSSKTVSWIPNNKEVKKASKPVGFDAKH
ncbi:hypothetical protein CR513_15250, partial [Mucuna pruriens]